MANPNPNIDPESQYLNPYERIWKTRDLSALDKPIELENNTSQFGRGINAFGKEMQATGYALAALGSQGLENVIGKNDVTSGITDWGLKGYKQATEEGHTGYNAPSVANVEDIKNASDFLDWGSYQLGKGLPMLGSLALSGGVGGAIGRLGVNAGVKELAGSAVGSVVKKGVEAGALKAAEGQVVTKAMQEAAAKVVRDRMVAGAVTGGFTGSFGLEGGQEFGELTDAGIAPKDAVAASIAVGGINGALEFLPFYKVAKDIGLGTYAKNGIREIIKTNPELSKKAIALAKEVGGRFLGGAAEGAVAEGVTEGLQELTSIAGLRWAKQDPLFADLSDDEWSRIGNASAAGALVGGTAAGAGATFKGPETIKAGTSPGGTAPKSNEAGKETPTKTREEALAEAQAKLATQLEAAKAVGDTKAADEIQNIIDALPKQEVVQTEITPPQEPVSAVELPSVEDKPVEAPTAEVPVTETPVTEATPVENPPSTPPAVINPNGSIQLKQGEEVILNPNTAPTTRVTPTPEEVTALQEKMGPRPEKQSIVDLNGLGAGIGEALRDSWRNSVEATGELPSTEQKANSNVQQLYSFATENNSGPKLPKTLATIDKVIKVLDEIGSKSLNDPESRRVIDGYLKEEKLKGLMPQEKESAITTEATMEEFEAIRRQFQERQSQTPFKKWFGTGIPNVTATKEGEPITLYHGTNNPAFFEWDSTKASEASGHPTSGLGFFMTADQGAAARYGNNLLELHAKINNPYTLTDADLTSIETPQDAVQLRKKLMNKGYDGAVVTAPGSSPYVIAFQANQIKLKSNTTPTESPDMRYSKPLPGRETSAPFYSALERAAQEAKQEKAPAAQWESTLDNMVKKGLVKQEELDWSGTKDWLQEQKGPVTKEALLKHVRDNTLEVQETELSGKDTRNTKWTLPGGENQRELVLTTPSIESFNTEDTTHYGDVGGGKAVAWVRFNDRMGEDGKKTLFLEEIQSKRHQEGKKEGYGEVYNEQEKEDFLKQLSNKGFHVSGDDIIGRSLSNKDYEMLPQELKTKADEVLNSKKVPEAPFKQTIAGSNQTLSGWAGLAFKRMLRYAVENGYDKVAWTTGEQQAERYSLSKQLEYLAWEKNEDGTYNLEANNKEGQPAFYEEDLPIEEVRAVVGQDIARQIENDEGAVTNQSPYRNWRRIEGKDLKIGGEGMKGFYDRLLPNEINKYVKKWGAKVDQTQIKVGDKSEAVHSVEVTPAMRESVMQGQPLFSKQQETQQNKTEKPTIESIRSNINSIMGEGWIEQAENLGLINIVEGAGPRGESGSWIGNKILLYTDSMPTNGSPAGVLLHEGEHHTFTKLLGNSLPEYVKDLHTLADNGNKVARDAISHAAIITADMLGIEHNLRENGTKADLNAIRALIEQERPGLLAEEELAYFVQHGADAQTGTGFWRRLVNQIKAWFAQTRLGQRMKELGIGFEMTDGMAVEWAKMGLNQSLAELQQQQEAKTRVEKQFAAMPASVRLGNALVAIENVDPLFSLGIKEISDQLWNDPTDVRLEIVNKPGLLQRWRADFVDFFAEIEKKSKDIYDTYSLLRSKKAARIEQARQEYFISLRDMIANSPWTAEEVGDMLAARHIKIDKVNLELAKRASYNYTKELLKNLSAAKMKELQQARVHVKAGKMPDGSVYKDANGNPAQMSARTKQQLMFDLMNKYSQLEIPNAEGVQVLKEEWELFKDAASGFSDGGVGSSKVRVVGDILKLAEKDRAKFGQIATVFDAANRHTLELLEDGGLITTAEHARLLADKSAYAPLRRAAYNINEETTKLLQRAGQGGSKQINTRAGTENLSEPTLVLQNALASVEAAGAAAERNLANKELYKVIVADKEGWKPWFTIVDEEKYITHDEDGFLSEKNATATNRADIALINDGKRLIIRPNMHNGRAIGFVRAVNNLDAQEFSGPMKVLGWLNQITRWVNVNASPVFLMMNAFRDPLTALYNVQATEAGKYTKEIFSPKVYKESFKALKKVFLDGNRDPTDLDVQWVEKWELAGGRASFIDELRSMDTTWKSFNAQVARRQGNIFGTTVPGFKGLMEAKDKWIDGIENFNILFENVMRFSTFKVLMEHNAVSEKQAARISQDLTTNFTRRGYKTQALGAWWLFFHASVQGNYQVVRNLMTSKKLQALTGGTIVMALMLDLMGRAVDDDWDKIPENDKERFIIFPLKVGGKQVRVPAPWVYNVVWRAGGLLGEVLSQVKKPQDALLDLSALTMSAFSPIGKPGSIAQVVSPTGFDPFMQIIENKNFFGNPIGPEGFPGASKKANSELMWSSTPKGYQSFARFVNEATGGSAVESGMIDLKPGDYQVLANFLTGSLGRFLSDATFGLKEALDKEFEGGPRDIPVVKEFFSDPYDPLNAQKYHTNVAGIYGAHKLEQLYLKGPDRDLIKLQEVRENRGEELRMYAQAQDVERQLKSIRVRLRVAQNQGDYMREKELRDKMSKIQERFNEVYKRKIG